MGLENKIIIITGGSGLIGEKISLDVLSKGGIPIVADINKPTNSELSKFYFHCDVTNLNSIDEFIQHIISKYNRIDGLVNNAYPRTNDFGDRFEDIKYSSWVQNIDIQLNSTFYITQKVIKYLVDTKGSVINIASIYGIVGNDMTLYQDTGINTVAPYSAIKGGIINFTRYLASYYGRKGVRFNCVSPGGIFNYQDPLFVERYENKVPLGRMGRPEDIAYAVSFLLSEEASYITGQNLVVDGGWTAI